MNQGVQGANGALDLSGSPASPKWLSGKSSTVQLNWCAGGGVETSPLMERLLSGDVIKVTNGLGEFLRGQA